MPNGEPTIEEIIQKALEAAGIGKAEQTPLEVYWSWINRLYYEGAITLEAKDTCLRIAERVTELRTDIPFSSLPHGKWAFVEDPKAQRRYISDIKKTLEAQTKATLAARMHIPPTGKREERLPELPIKEPEAAREIPPMPGAREAALPFLERLPPSAKEYFESQLGRLYTPAISEAREKWWRALQPPAPPDIGRPGEAMTPEERGAKMVLGQRYGYEDYGQYTGEMLAAGYTDISEFEAAKTRAEEVGGFLPFQRGATPAELPTRERAFEIERGLRAEERERPAPPPRDPWEAHLAEYPFLSKWMERPPRKRGFFPGRLAPTARWRT